LREINPFARRDKLIDTVLGLAKEKGAVYPALADVSDGSVCVVDTDNGTVYTIDLKVMK